MIRLGFGGRPWACLLLSLASFALTGRAYAGPSPTLDAARAHRSLACGVVVEQEDFARSDTHGDLSAFGSAICRAVAAATMGDAKRVQLLGFPDDAHGIAALTGRKVDLLVGTTPAATTAMLRHLRFSPDLFIDGQSFMLNRTHGVHTADGLRDKLVCYVQATPADAALSEWSAAAHVAVRRHPFSETGEMEAALTTGNCQAVMSSVSSLADMRTGFHGRRKDFIILPQMVTVDPFAAATREGDAAWSTIVADVVTVLIEAEQQGITQANQHARGNPATDPAGARLLGPTPGLVSLLGLADGWAGRAIAAGGNYGEIFDRTLGAKSELDLQRSYNRLWSQGGMIAAPAIP